MIERRLFKVAAAALGATLMVSANAQTGLAEEDAYRFGGVFTLSGPASFLGLFEEAAAPVGG
jgi:hypothetical protein